MIFDIQYLIFCLRLEAFGFRLGMVNLARNGVSLGLKKTIGKIAQPVNAPDRFVEHFWVWRYLQRLGSGRILDISSPKLLSLFATRYLSHRACIVAADVVAEYLTEWRLMGNLLVGRSLDLAKLHIASLDARQIGCPDGWFDAVYSISVLEHIPGDGDSAALQELIRVVKPGGYVLITLPFDNTYREQYKQDDVYERRYQGEPIFFQRIYDSHALAQLLDAVRQHIILEDVCVGSEIIPYMPLFISLHENVRGILGLFSFIVALVNYRSAHLTFDEPCSHKLKSAGFVFVALRKIP